MDATLLVVNSGSSSVKLALYHCHDFTPVASALAERLGDPEARLTLKTPEKHTRSLAEGAGHQQAIDQALAGFRELGLLDGAPRAIGHRVVHGGEAFTRSVRIDASVRDAIRQCTPLAPLHNPANLAGIEAMTVLYPDLPQVAVFDTAFHQSLSPQAYLYALPYHLYEQHGVRRYGFHGTSHRFMLSRTAAHLGKVPEQTSLISAHLGNGCSITAIHNGCSRDTSMGLTPLEGLVMGTRSGDLDPGLFDFLIQQGRSPEAINHMLNRDSGLMGLSGGLSNDMRSLIEARERGDEQAALAVSVFCYRLARYIGTMNVASGAPDALVFTGGIGENSAEVRQETLAHLTHMGFALDAGHNRDHGQRRNGEIQAEGSYPILVIATDEERVIAEDTATLTLDGSPLH